VPSINDNFADAIEVEIATDGGTYTSPSLANTGNTTETNEPVVGSSGSLSMWFKYTPTSSGTATFDTQLTTAITSTDSYLAIWTGTALTNLVNVAADDDGGGSGTSRVAGLSVTSGTTYWVQCAGYGNHQMNMVLRVVGPATTGGGGSPVDLTPADSAHAHAVESPSLTQAHALAPVDSAHGHAADAPALTQTHVLAPAGTAHSHAVESPVLTQVGDLSVADSQHTHATESPTLTQAHVLVPAESTHGHAATSPTLTTGTTLQPADSIHGHVVEQPTLTQAHQLAPDDSSHEHTAEAPALTQVHEFAPADSVHSHVADSPLVFIPSGLPPPAANTVVTPAEDRILTVAAENRIVTTPAETRIITD
jgi:hypothetical protein